MTATIDAPPASSERLITPQFLLITATSLVYFTYVGILVPLVPSLIEDGYGGSKFDIGLAMAVFSIIAILCRPILARFGERYGMRPVIVSGALIALVATLACTRADNLWTLLPLRCLQGVGEAFVFVGGATLASQAAAPTRRAEAASYYSVAVFCGIGVGPMLSDPLVNKGHYDSAFLLGAAFVAVTLLLGLLTPNAVSSSRATRGATAASSDSLATDASASDALAADALATGALATDALATDALATDALAVVVAKPSSTGGVDQAVASRRRRVHPDAVLPGLILAIGIAAFTPFNAFMPAYAKAVGFGGAAIAFGLYSAICLTFRIVGAKLPERLGLPRTVSMSLGGIAGGMAILAAWPSRIGVIAGTAVMALGISMLYPALAGLATRRASNDEQVRVMSAFTMFFEIGVVTGALGFGLIGNLTSRRGAFAAAAICAALGWLLVRVKLVSKLNAR